jgi:hypothetical protein
MKLIEISVHGNSPNSFNLNRIAEGEDSHRLPDTSSFNANINVSAYASLVLYLQLLTVIIASSSHHNNSQHQRVHSRSMNGSETTLLRKFPLFAGLSPEELAVAEEHMFESRYEPGEHLFQEGDDGGYVCFILDGVLEVLKKNSTGEEVSLAEMHMGQSIGEMSLVDDMKRSATVRSVGQSRVQILTKKGFRLLMRQHPRIAAVMLEHFTKMLSATVRSTSKELADMLAVSAEHTQMNPPS